jgi:fibronectin type 3 domain-containing protein
MHTVALSWGTSSTSGVTYNIYRGTTPGGEGTSPINTSAISETTFTDTNVTSGQEYYYVVEAVDSDGNSEPSNEAAVSIPTP